MNIFEEYKDKIISIIKKAEKNKLLILPDKLNSVNVDSTPPKIDFDISTNVSMVLSKTNNKSPKDLAHILIDLLKKEDKNIKEIETLNEEEVLFDIYTLDNSETESVYLSAASINKLFKDTKYNLCLLYTSPSPRDVEESRMPSSA